MMKTDWIITALNKSHCLIQPQTSPLNEACDLCLLALCKLGFDSVRGHIICAVLFLYMKFLLRDIKSSVYY